MTAGFKPNIPVADAAPTRLLKPERAAAFLGLSKSWLAKSRMTGDGPPHVKIGAAIRYDFKDLQAFVAARLRSSTSDNGEGA